MPSQLLAHRTIIDIEGPDAASFLQNLVTANIDTMDENIAYPCALLTPQGKIAFEFLISKSNEIYRLDIHQDIADSLVQKLTLYKLRANLEITKPQISVYASWLETDLNNGTTDYRFTNNNNALRHYNESKSLEDQNNDYDDFRITHGIAEAILDYDLNDVFPHDVLMDKNSAIDFKKGCYVGQEVVSRMQHRGTARKRLVQISANVALPEKGTDILASGKPIGKLGSSSGKNGLAIIRLDKFKDAIEQGEYIYIDDIEINASLPDWSGLNITDTAE